MKIRQIKISNILSFPYVEDLPNMEGIHFNDKAGSNLHILIGANGSGKSNFIEIINQFARNLISDYTFNKYILQEKKKSDYQKAIQFISKKTSKLSKHSKFQDKPAGIEITLELFENDFENIGFVCEYTDIINHIIGKYSTLKYRFPHYRIEDIVQQCKTIHICADFSEKEQTFTIHQDKLTPLELFALICIQEQELLYICVRIFNEFERNDEELIKKKVCPTNTCDIERMWYPLKNTFSIISSKRDSNARKYLNECREFDNYIFQTRDLISQNLEGFYKVLYKIWTIINKNSQEILLNPDPTMIDKNIETRLYNSGFWKKLTKAVKRFINKDLFLEYIQGEISLKLRNEQGNIYYLSDLSSGQQSILLILFAIYGNDLKDGFMIIDEPELHTHPQLQKELAILLNQLSEQNGTQFFLSTYSALFINEENITNVYRFKNKHTGDTQIFNPHLHIASDDAKLVHLLRYENLSKIFFVDKIILVEGDSDGYFFAHYLKWLQEQPEWEDIVGTYELININGKGSYKSRNRFLNRF
ncbi:MAG: AAA family ATPase [Clostridiales Family XIII bacterium]|jgi:predicted ATP-dependent endonuclease of OLD family|nr:AAA family ATPase [Clostridiales Family XIII bacterium]